MENAVIYLHFPCFDGVISAVLAAEILEKRFGWTVTEYRPVNYDRMGEWRSERLPHHSAVVDFLYHPDPQMWADHHATTFVVPGDRVALDRPDGRLLVYDANSPSCALLLWKRFPDCFASSERFGEMAYWANKIDSADYSSVVEAVRGESPASQISYSLAIRHDPEYCDFLVRNLRARDLAYVAGLPDVQEPAREARRQIEAGLDQVAGRIALSIGDIAVCDVTQPPGTIVNRYSPYLFYPNARYSVSLVRSPDNAKITAMRNPWLDFESMPLGALFKRFGGGGHTRVASVLVPIDEAPKALDMLGAIVDAIREAESQTPERQGIEA
jgi:hypothetical protein